MPRIVIIAGEASGDQLGASLIRSANRLRPDLQFEGVAGPAMREAGCKCWVDSEELSVMGLFEILRHLPRLLKIKRRIEKQLLADPPDVLVGIDAPDFNLRIERVAHRAGIPTVHYVCPSVWAWRQSRINVLREACDLTLCLLPFEAAFLKRHRTPGEFVGHPLADEIPDTVDRLAARSSMGVNAETVIAMLPGSRESEVSRLGPLFAQTANWLSARGIDADFLVPAATASLGAIFSADWQRIAPNLRVRIVTGRAQECIAAADVVLVASGTATLETMLLKRPMVVVYKMSVLTYWLLKIFDVVKSSHISLPNLLSAETLVPELIQEQAAPETTGREILEWLRSPEQQRELARRFASLHNQLRCSAADRAASAVLRIGGLGVVKQDSEPGNPSLPEC